MDLLKLLWPNFSVLMSGNTDAISAWFWLVMAGIFTVAMALLVINAGFLRARLTALRSLLEGQTKEQLALSRREILQRATALKNTEIGLLWREFDESLVSSSDQKQLFNTLDAEHFFNARTLAPGLTASRLLAATPSFLVAIGVLGTFVGLTIGLANLQIDSQSGVDQMRSGIDLLIQGAAVAFMTSVWGVTFSLALNFIEKIFERSALRKIQILQRSIDYLYPRILAEQSLVHIADSGRESSAALLELHERIGDRLQESLQGMNEAMQTALTDTLNSIMGPAIGTLVNSANQQSTQVLEKLVGNFMEGMTSVGREQGGLMQQAAVDVNAAVGAMSERLNQLFHTLSDQQGRQQVMSDQQSRQFAEQLQRAAEASEQREQQLEQRFNQLMTGLGSQLSGQLNTAEQREQARADRHDQQLNAMADTSNKQQRELQSAFDQLLVNLNDQMSEHTEQAEQREQSRQQRLSESMEVMVNQQQMLLDSISRSVQTTQQQSLQIADQHRQLLGQLQHSTEAVTTSSKHMDSSAYQLGILSTNVRQAAELLGQRLESVTARIEEASTQNAELAHQLQGQSSSLAALQTTLLQGAQHFENAASEAHEGFVQMKTHQQEFLTGVRIEFTALGEALTTQVSEIEKQAEGWLRSYSSEVNQQVHERMDQWNKQTLSFADQMYAAVQAISNVVDELEAR